MWKDVAQGLKPRGATAYCGPTKCRALIQSIRAVPVGNRASPSEVRDLDSQTFVEMFLSSALRLNHSRDSLQVWHKADFTPATEQRLQCRLLTVADLHHQPP